MHVIRADSSIIVTLPLAERDPWPGAVPVALAMPLVLGTVLLAAVSGALGDLAPWLVGGAPVLTLFGPLFWLIRRSRVQVATLVMDALVLRVVHSGRAPEFRRGSLRAAVAWDRLSVEDDAQRVELDLEPLDGDDVRTLREVLRELTRAG